MLGARPRGAADRATGGVDRYSRRGRHGAKTACAPAIRAVRVGTRGLSNRRLEILIGLTFWLRANRGGRSEAASGKGRVVARCAVWIFVAAVLLGSGAAAGARAQNVRAPEVGGRTVSLGQPLRWHWQLGLGGGAYLGGTSSDLMIRAWGGGYRASMNPVTKLVEFGLEGYVGVRGSKADAGTRALLQIPYLSAGAGPDYNIRTGHLDLVFTVHTPVRRGGFLTRGTMLRLDWYPTLCHSFFLGVSAPLHDPLAGRNRPIQDYVVVAAPFHTPQTHEPANSVLRAELDSLAESAASVRRLIVPFLDQDGRSERVALARTQRYIPNLKTHLAVRSAGDEV